MDFERRTRDPDADCVERVLAGEADAFRPLVERYERPVHGLIRRLLGSAGREAEDLTQDTFVRAYEYLGRLQKRERFGPWVFQIARSLCRDRVRRLDTERRALRECWEKLRLDSVRPGETGVASALSELPVEEYDVLKMRYFEGLTYEAIAERLGTSFSRVDHTIRKARARLARRLHVEKRRERAL